MVLQKIPTFEEVKNWVNNNADVPNADHANNANYATNAGDASTIDGKDPSELGGANPQANSPNYESGAIWANTQNGSTYIGRNGGFRPVTPITTTDEAITFNESELSLNGGVAVQNNKIVSPEAWDVTTYHNRQLFDMDNVFSQVENKNDPQDFENVNSITINFDQSGKYCLAWVYTSRDDYYICLELSTPWDINSASYHSRMIIPNHTDGEYLNSSIFVPGGERLWAVSGTTIYEFPLSTPYDLSTVGTSTKYELSQNLTYPTNFEDSNNSIAVVGGGHHLYTMCYHETISYFEMSNAWDLSSIKPDSYADWAAWADYDNSGSAYGMYISEDGTRIFTADRDNDVFHEHEMTNPYDIDSGRHIRDISISPTLNYCKSIFIHPDGTRFWMNDRNDRRSITQFELSGGYPNTFTLGWNMPNKISGWDMATFQTNRHDLVTIDIVDEHGNVLISDVGPNWDVSSVDKSTNFELRVTFENPNGGTEPVLEYAGRRATR